MGTGVYPAQGEAQGAWGTQPLEEKVKVEQGLFFAEIAAFNYEREVIEMAEDMTKGKEETNSHKLLHGKFQPGKNAKGSAQQQAA